MALVPILVAGKTRLVEMPLGASARDQWYAEQENTRRAHVSKRRLYYDGSQYDDENLETYAANGLDPLSDRLPEHLRKHAYSTQIQESVDFIADQLAEGFALVFADGGVQSLIDLVLRSTERLSGVDDDDDLAIDDVLREALNVGDVPVEVRWDPVEATCYLEFWECEQVEFRWLRQGRLEKVVRDEVVWVIEPETGQDRQVLERVQYEVVMNEAGYMECRRQTFWDQEEAPRDTQWLGMPIIPWGLLRADGKDLRGTRGESLITDQAMETADRYNANEQVAWLIARYNSHANLVVVGDAASLKIEQEGHVDTDVADVLTFPGGSDAKALLLPTDPQMIEHQREVLADHLFGVFGLTRIDQSTVQNIGAVSGYALEILNRKTEGTFRRVRRNWIKDVKTLCSLILDVTAYKRDATAVLLDPETLLTVPFDVEDVTFVIPEGTIPMVAFWDVDPTVVFPNRVVEVTMGSGYIVDDVMLRDDYVAGLISRHQALARRGWSPEEIKANEDEIEQEKPPVPEGLAPFPPGAPTKTKAGGTVGTATKPAAKEAP